MRRFLTTIAIILVVVIAGLSMLVLLVNPNDFRGYMVKKVAEKTGYQLNIEGDLRWHVWPKVSILTGQMTLTAPGAVEPLVSADNVRLDIELLPLLSHQLVVKNVVLKSSVIRFVPQTQKHTTQKAPIAPNHSTQALSFVPASASLWSLDLHKIVVTDSLLVWARDDNEQINVRDLNVTLSRTDARQAALSAKARIHRNQRELSFSLDGALDLTYFPQEVTLNVERADYQLAGVDLPVDGIKGNSQFMLAYQSAPKRMQISPMRLTLNDNELTGTIAATFGPIAEYNAVIESQRFNVDRVFPVQTDNAASTVRKATKEVPTPVISSANGLPQQPDFTFLRQFNARLSLNVGELTVRDALINEVQIDVKNQLGRAELETLTGKWAGGSVSVTGTMDATLPTPFIKLEPQIQHITLADVLALFDYPQVLTGQLNLRGTFVHRAGDIKRIMTGWQGRAHMEIADARLHGLNIQQLIQQAVVRSQQNIQGLERYERFTEVDKLIVDGDFNDGQINVAQLQGASDQLTISGSGMLNLRDKQSDMALNIRVLEGWRGRPDVINVLQTTTIPLRIYGPWEKLSYQLDVDNLLRDRLKNQVGKALERWIDRNKERPESKDVQKLLDRLR